MVLRAACVAVAFAVDDEPLGTVIGIDLGTTYCVQERTVQIIANDQVHVTQLILARCM
jgi:hypothetical protein